MAAKPKSTIRRRLIVIAATVGLILCLGFFTWIITAANHIVSLTHSDASAAAVPDTSAPSATAFTAGIFGTKTAGISEGLHAIIGEIFLNNGKLADAQEGVRLQLVRYDDLIPLLEEIHKRHLAEGHAVQALDLCNQLQNTYAEIKRLNAIIPEKEKEVTSCRKDHWAEFTYVHPVTREASKQIYQLDLRRTDENVIALMNEGIAAARTALSTQNGNVGTTTYQIEQQLSRAKSQVTTFYPPTNFERSRLESSITTIQRFLNGRATLQQVAMDTTNNIIRAVDHCTVDKCHATMSGHFKFKALPFANYLVFANSDNCTWLVPVNWESNNTPRRVVLSSQNTVNFQHLFEQARNSALLPILKTFLKAAAMARFP